MCLCVRSIGICLSSRILLHDFGTVLTVWYFSTWFRNCSDNVVFFYMISELLWQRCIFLNVFSTWFRNCWQCGTLLDDFRTALTVLYLCTCCSTWFRNCSDSVVFFYVISELFWQCGIFLHDFWTVLTLWYFSKLFLNCSDSVVFFDMMHWERCIFLHVFLHDFGTVLTVWYFSIWCSDSLVFFYMFVYMISEQFWQCGIFLHIFLHDFGTVLAMWYFLHDVGTALTALYFSKCFFYMISELFWQCGILLDDFRTALTVL